MPASCSILDRARIYFTCPGGGAHQGPPRHSRFLFSYSATALLSVSFRMPTVQLRPPSPLREPHFGIAQVRGSPDAHSWCSMSTPWLTDVLRRCLHYKSSTNIFASVHYFAAFLLPLPPEVSSVPYSVIGVLLQSRHSMANRCLCSNGVQTLLSTRRQDRFCFPQIRSMFTQEISTDRPL
ncbi:hypothetical protein L226DRAFT_92344 [Lentinus tigrinus ALCF2SS1-7]|uniref:Uncharacterized protein n=1 Tax=Lentinus tigrinus ALCF2SS1-6 TaxID=1328759 RepID=A0A5C2RYN4_9APHY|nr:hypothetical protein L227DRAFT_287517 [Lentinus tigrinus ALCF2SS1-6]RPD73989.1 hypothetical protein L226DRAFT_92344 [Lentinus tigrinus ALCF2SS1-7]